jgi:hypothetical protein
MIDKLISGYCFVSVIGTGYCGSTIELFRTIGLFDERYLGSEYEDDDFQAWCYECEKVRVEHDGWNDESMEFSDIKLVCEKCYFEIKESNK